jgi:hypothetical protein
MQKNMFGQRGTLTQILTYLLTNDYDTSSPFFLVGIPFGTSGLVWDPFVFKSLTVPYSIYLGYLM